MRSASHPAELSVVGMLTPRPPSGSVLKKADQAVSTGDDRDAGDVGILDLDEGGCACRQRQVNDQACAFLAGRTLRSVKLSLQARWQVHGMRSWRKALSLPEPGVDFGRGFVTLDVERRGMTRRKMAAAAATATHRGGRGRRAAAIAQALLIVLALGMGGAGLVLPLDSGDLAEPISMLIVTEDATEAAGHWRAAHLRRRRQPRRNARSGRNRRQHDHLRRCTGANGALERAVQTCA